MTLSEVAACSGISYDTLLRAVRAADSGVPRKFHNPQSIRIGEIFSKLGGPTVRVLASKILPLFGGPEADAPEAAEDAPSDDADLNAKAPPDEEASSSGEASGLRRSRARPTSAKAKAPSTASDTEGKAAVRDRFGKKEASRMRKLSDDNLAALLRSAIDDLRKSNTAAHRERIEEAVAAMRRRKMDVPQIVVRGLSIERMKRDSTLFSTIGDFLSASPQGSGKTWLFVRVAGGRPVDLLTASTDEIEQGILETLTLEEYLEAMAGALADERSREAALREQAEIEADLAAMKHSRN